MGGVQVVGVGDSFTRHPFRPDRHRSDVALALALALGSQASELEGEVKRGTFEDYTLSPLYKHRTVRTQR